jgi:hypothetical protein
LEQSGGLTGEASGGSGLSNGGIAGIVSVSVLLVGVAVVVIGYCMTKNQRNRRDLGGKETESIVRDAAYT